MFKKITSNRDPRDTLLGELKREFGEYYAKMAFSCLGFVNRYPRQVFAGMILLIVVSAGLSFTVCRKHEPDVKSSRVGKVAQNPMITGLGQVMATGEALREAISLKQEVDSLIVKKHLSKTDSVQLENALDQLQQINSRLK